MFATCYVQSFTLLTSKILTSLDSDHSNEACLANLGTNVPCSLYILLVSLEGHVAISVPLCDRSVSRIFFFLLSLSVFSGEGILGGAPALTAWVTYRETKMVQRMKELCQYRELLTLCPRIYKWLILNEVYTVKALAAKIYMKRLYRGHLSCCIPNHGKKRKVEKKKHLEAWTTSSTRAAIIHQAQHFLLIFYGKHTYILLCRHVLLLQA